MASGQTGIRSPRSHPVIGNLLHTLTLLSLAFVHQVKLSSTASAHYSLDPVKSNGYDAISGISCDFEDSCEWGWDEGTTADSPGFQLMTGQQVLSSQEEIANHGKEIIGPHADASNQSNGHFLLLTFTKGVNQSGVHHLRSPWFNQADATCSLEAMLHMNNMKDDSVKMLKRTQDNVVWVPVTELGYNKNTWERLKKNIGKTTQPFQVSLEIEPGSKVPSHIAIDNISLVNCFPKPIMPSKFCSPSEFRCQQDICINRSRVCDFEKDCANGEDEDQNCERMPVNTTCNFEKDWCGWTNVSENSIEWKRTNKPSTSPLTGPSYGDHTFGHSNTSGHFLYVNMNARNSKILDKTMLRSPVYAPPPFYHQNVTSPYYNSCQLRFFYHMFGPHIGSLHVEVIELNPKFPRSSRLWTMSRDQGNFWHRESRPLPKLDGMYYIQFVATRGARFAGDIALDDISLSPECVGFGVPSSELRGYNYDATMNKLRAELRPGVVTMSMQNISKYEFTTCGNTGRLGPSPDQCESTYRNTPLNGSVEILRKPERYGIQVWTVPASMHYTLVAKGASGGRGAFINQIGSHGSIVKVTLFLRKGEKLYILVGQEGASVCEQNVTLPDKVRDVCEKALPQSSALQRIQRIIRSPKGGRSSSLTELQRISTVLGGGGGGGGATFVYRMEGNSETAILVAAGGGGLAYNASPNILPNGRELNVSLEARSGSSQAHGAGGGGGWKGSIVPVNVDFDSLDEISRILGPGQSKRKDNETMWISAGKSLLDGAGLGGLPCADSRTWGTVGGFGGGGGGCTSGGAGGGYVGGNAHKGLSANGEGGISYITKGGMYPSVEPGGHDGAGSLVVIPSVVGCGCDYRCVLLDDFRFHSACVCPENWILVEDGFSCTDRDIPVAIPYFVGVIVIAVVMFSCVGLLCICLYNRYQRQKVANQRRKVMNGPELQLSRLRAASGPGGVLTEYNPNYEFGGETYNLTDLKEIPRENLRLVKALGQGAFGEVYQGFYKHRAGDAVEMPVAVKTLPELSTNQAEMDFLMEALIMSKFNHPNIVHFIGVCFDKHPRFIILELLAGGDLKTFLRESRPKPERGSPLTMKDLLLCAMDVAKGCKYLEENHFIHRDIAARNCLLTTKGPGRVVKIADFGMARDIYRADYYKKGGKAMLPVKWMPPEAFLDGIFTSKTDVWSYGVLLWEVLSLGYMPYPGRGNQDVMQLVTNGGRLEPPTNCPAPVYGIMTQCWHPIPEERPNFGTLLERVGYCIQDPEVVNAPLPVFQRPPSSERDATLMRPQNLDDQSCLRIVHGHRISNATTASADPSSPNSSTADYLVPLTPYSFAPSKTTSTDTVSSPTTALPESESIQTLLEDDEGVVDLREKQGIVTPNYHVTQPSSRKHNGLDNGLTLNAASLEKPSGRRPGPYANVGVKKTDKKKAVDEEIRC